MSLLIVSGPTSPGPGEREKMLDTAVGHFAQHGVATAEVIRIDVPGRGAGDEGDGSLRADLDPAIPVLQSGSLFGEPQGLELVDAQNLRKTELDTLLELMEGADLAQVEVAVLWAGSVPKALKDLARERGQTIEVSRMRPREAAKWLDAQIADRGLDFGSGAAQALLDHYGTDTSGMARALDQLAETGNRITVEMIHDRFKNRPDEPTWLITDAIDKGDVSTALRRLADFLVHEHPLVYLAVLESDLKKRALAAAAPDKETFVEWVGGGPPWVLDRTWAQRGRVRESSLRSAQKALVRADRVVKSQPEEMHRVTLERLTVALCRWYD
ncbi:MAG: DNA polymerase III subunit delta [Acidimicrobiia bacterium]